MGDFFHINEPLDEGRSCHVQLMKDDKMICQIKCHKPPFQMFVLSDRIPGSVSFPGEFCACPVTTYYSANCCTILNYLNRFSPKIGVVKSRGIHMPSKMVVSKIIAQKSANNMHSLPQCLLHPDPRDGHQKREWKTFLHYLQEHKKVALGNIGSCEYYILPPNEVSQSSAAVMRYHIDATSWLAEECPSSRGDSAESGSHMVVKKYSPTQKFHDTGDQQSPQSGVETLSRTEHDVMGENRPLEKNYIRAHPSYLKTLSQAHSGWIFGAVAELVDNSRDAKATKLEISINSIYSKKAGKEIPMLLVIDDGHGMTHQDIVRMLSFGHKQPDADDANHIGIFGVGFKTGAMRLGKDALVLTQTSNSRSIAFLSQSLNEGRNNLEIPIVSYCRKGQIMEVDTSVQTEALAKYNLKAIKEFSPFNKFLIGEKVGLFGSNGTGTQIYIFNLDEWGSNYSLEWKEGKKGSSSFHEGDICIRSRRIRTRPGQMTRSVPLDFSLRSYLELIFLNPRMKIYVQESPVKSRPLAKSLECTVEESGCIIGKRLQLILGRSQLEWEQANCGIFLYWHGRLVEAYKRVGTMVHNGDKYRGIIGVIDVTELMDDGNGHVWVHSNKQGFQDCEVYALLEDWLGRKVDKYLDENVDKLEVKMPGILHKPDHEWVQCDKCRKWRMLSSDFDSKTLPDNWFCFMEPFGGKCEDPEQKIGCGVITIYDKRAGCDVPENLVGPVYITRQDYRSRTEDVKTTTGSLKRLRSGPSRSIRKS